MRSCVPVSHNVSHSHRVCLSVSVAFAKSTLFNFLCLLTFTTMTDVSELYAMQLCSLSHTEPIVFIQRNRIKQLTSILKQIITSKELFGNVVVICKHELQIDPIALSHVQHWKTIDRETMIRLAKFSWNTSSLVIIDPLEFQEHYDTMIFLSRQFQKCIYLSSRFIRKDILVDVSYVYDINFLLSLVAQFPVVKPLFYVTDSKLNVDEELRSVLLYRTSFNIITSKNFKFTTRYFDATPQQQQHLITNHQHPSVVHFQILYDQKIQFVMNQCQQLLDTPQRTIFICSRFECVLRLIKYQLKAQLQIEDTTRIVLIDLCQSRTIDVFEDQNDMVIMMEPDIYKIFELTSKHLDFIIELALKEDRQDMQILSNRQLEHDICRNLLSSNLEEQYSYFQSRITARSAEDLQDSYNVELLLWYYSYYRLSPPFTVRSIPISTMTKNYARSSIINFSEPITDVPCSDFKDHSYVLMSSLLNKPPSKDREKGKNIITLASAQTRSEYDFIYDPNLMCYVCKECSPSAVYIDLNVIMTKIFLDLRKLKNVIHALPLYEYVFSAPKDNVLITHLQSFNTTKVEMRDRKHTNYKRIMFIFSYQLTQVSRTGRISQSVSIPCICSKPLGNVVWQLKLSDLIKRLIFLQEQAR